MGLQQFRQREQCQVPLMRRKRHAMDRNQPDATGSNEVGEALPPNGIGRKLDTAGSNENRPLLIS
jgi:hypothetical protein